MSALQVLAIIGIVVGVADMMAWLKSGQQRFKKWRYIIPVIGGWMALYDKHRS